MLTVVNDSSKGLRCQINHILACFTPLASQIPTRTNYYMNMGRGGGASCVVKENPAPCPVSYITLPLFLPFFPTCVPLPVVLTATRLHGSDEDEGPAVRPGRPLLPAAPPRPSTRPPAGGALPWAELWPSRASALPHGHAGTHAIRTAG